MKSTIRNNIAIIVIIFTIIISGCTCCSLFEHYELVKRKYTNNASNNITINIYKSYFQNFDVQKSNDSNIKVVERFNLKSQYVKNSNFYVDDFVKFIGDGTNLMINISTINTVGLSGELDIHSVNITVYVPNNSNYTVNYVYDESLLKLGHH